MVRIGASGKRCVEETSATPPSNKLNTIKTKPQSDFCHKERKRERGGVKGKCIERERMENKESQLANNDIFLFPYAKEIFAVMRLFETATRCH